MSLLSIVVAEDVFEDDTIAQQLTGVDKLLLVGGGFPRVHLGQVSLEPPNRPGGFAFDRLIVELLIRGFDYQGNIHDATTAGELASPVSRVGTQVCVFAAVGWDGGRTSGRFTGPTCSASYFAINYEHRVMMSHN